MNVLLRRGLCAASLAFLAVGVVRTQARLIADINKQPVRNGLGSFPNDFVRVGATMLFTTAEPQHGTRIWRTDGTTRGTVPVFGMARSELFQVQLTYAAAVGKVLYFRAQSLSLGSELWRTDGTTAGTFLVKDIVPGSGSSSPSQFAVVGTTVFFAASTPSTGIELWRSDGTRAGTVLVADLQPGVSSSRPFFLEPFGSRVLFSANAKGSGQELWISDGTPIGTLQLGDLLPGPRSSYPRSMVVLGKVAVFAANSPLGLELWRTDGTAAGTKLVKDIRAGAGHSVPSGLTVSGRWVYFAADDGRSGNELWRTDGTTAGTRLVKDIASGPSASRPRELVAFRGGVLFDADTTSGSEPWFSDGTASGTMRLSRGARKPAKFAVVPAVVPFAVFRAGGSLGRELWRTDGTPGGTHIVKDIRAGSADAISQRNNYVFGILGTTIVFAANDGNVGEEVWRSDGTAAGTQLLKDIVFAVASSFPRALGEIDGRLLFTANDGKVSRQLWTTDGTTAGTRQLFKFPGSAGAALSSFVRLGRFAYFLTNPLTRELWRTDGTQGGTSRVSKVGAPSLVGTPLVRVGNRLFFALGTALWVSDGTATGTKVLRSFTVRPFVGAGPRELTTFRGKLWFVAEDSRVISLWSSDGTSAGTRRFPTAGHNPFHLMVSGPRLFFVNSTNATGSELWSTDGTATGTRLVKDIVPGPSSSFPRELTDVRGKLFFVAGLDAELWVSDATGAGTRLVKNIHPSRSSAPRSLTPLGNRLLFHAESPAFGREPWISDGTSAGTVLLRDVRPGTASSLASRPRPSKFTIVGSGRIALFAADDGTHGSEVWRTDGTTAGTFLAADVAKTHISSRPTGFALAGTTVVFAASDVTHGNELFGIRLIDLRDSLAKPIGLGCAGSGNRTPTLAPIGLPTLGNGRFALGLSGAAIGAPAVLSLGSKLGRVVYGPRCVSPNAAPIVFLPFAVSGAGTARLPLPIPGAALFRGATLVAETIVFDRGGRLLGFASLSNALLLMAGD